MLNALLTVSGAIVALGVASLCVFGAAALYAGYELVRRARPLSAFVALAALALALTHVGATVLALAASALVLAQAGSYAYFAARTVLRRKSSHAPWSRALPKVSVIVPAKDESLVIDSTLRSLDGLDYPPELLDLVLLDDGSRDGMAAIAAARAAKMRHRLRIISHASSAGKALRLNELTHALDSDYLLVLDADHWVEPDLIRRLLADFASDPRIACVQVASSVRNAGTNLLSKLLELEYQFRYRGVYPGKRMGVFLGSGGMFERRALTEAGGFDGNMLTEDTEISYRLYKHGRRILYDDELGTRELAPTDFRNFFNQRHRWMRGLWQAMTLHLLRRGTRRLPRRLGVYFVQFTLDGFGALCLCWLQALLALRAFGWLELSAAFALPVCALLASSALAFAVGALRSRRPLNLLLVPLLPIYIVLHTIPTAWALVDSYLLRKPMIWVKTERVSRRPPAGREREPAAGPEREPESPSSPLASGST